MAVVSIVVTESAGRAPEMGAGISSDMKPARVTNTIGSTVTREGRGWKEGVRE